jgi:uncharacterized protein (TIGR03083 family)
VTEMDTITKERLLENMRSSEREFLQAVGELGADQWAEVRYEEGWTAKDILAHVASVEWQFPKLLVPGNRPSGRVPGSGERSSGGIHEYNKRQVDKRRDHSVEALLEEFERNRKQTIAAVEETAEEALRAQVRTAGGTEGTAAEVLNFLTVTHLRMHLDDIRRMTSE